MTVTRAMTTILLVAGGFLSGCGGGDPAEEGPETTEAWEGDVEAAARLIRSPEGTAEDWAILAEKASLAWEEGWDTLAMGESMARIGETFVGTAYVPQTLELPGEEQVVVNLQELDCVTFVENVMALARFVRLAEPEILESDIATRTLYMDLLREIRYRGGRVEGYPSRLHYFSDWIQDNERKGIVRELTADMGGIVDPRAIDFMSVHPEAYRQLADPSFLQAVRERESFLSGLSRSFIPEDEIASRVSWIEDGDIIATTSVQEGLDVAHTGLALWRGDALHLLHAPLVGEAVEVSREPLADRILRLEGQDGIRIVRPLEPGTR